MALSDEERARLERLEQELAASDPDLYRKLQSGMPGGKASGRSVWGVMAAIAGFALVIAGIITRLALIGAIGFLLMVAGAYFFLYGLPQQNRPRDPVQ